MKKEITVTAKTVEEAVARAVAELGAPCADAISYTVLEEDIVGKYVGKLPLGQMLSGFLDKFSEQNFYFLVVIVPIVLCLTSSVIQLVKEIRQK